ncbi:MAG: HD domain-containing phosphohydrolase [Acidobacteriota bacterium]
MPFRNTSLLRRGGDLGRDKGRLDPEVPEGDAIILVVEKDQAELDRLSNLLEAWDYQVVRADDGKQALRMVRKAKPALVVTSLELSGLTGIELCEKIKNDEETAHIPCICVAFPEEIANAEIPTGLFTGECLHKPVSARLFKKHIKLAFKASRPKEPSPAVAGDGGVTEIDRYLEEYEQQKLKKQSKPGRKKAAKKKASKKTTKKKVTKQAAKKNQTARKKVLPVPVTPAPPLGPTGIDDILEEFGLKPSQKSVPSKQARPEPEYSVPRKQNRPRVEYSELDLARLDLQQMRGQESVNLPDPSDLYDESQAFVLDSIRKADRGEGPDVEAAGKLVGSLGASLDSSIDLLLKSTDRAQPFSLSNHCVNVAVFGMTMAKTSNFDDESLQKVGVAALLHEIGAVKLPQNLIYKEGGLNRNEVELLRQRPQQSADILRSLGPDYSWLVEIVSQVYERENGAGFPLGLPGNAIVEEAKILGVADIFEACIHVRPYRAAMTGYEALRQLTSDGVKLFSDRIVKSLMNSFTLYPYNEYVKLNSGEIGQVVEVNRHNLFRPVVRILYDRQGNRVQEMRTADLGENASLFISQAITVDALPQSR